MMKKIKTIIWFLAVAFLIPLAANAAEEAKTDSTKPTPKDIIFEHLGDGYGWEVPFDHHHRIPLPVILIGVLLVILSLPKNPKTFIQHDKPPA